MTTALKLKKLEFGGYATKDGMFRIFNYMNVWTVVQDINGEEELTDFMTLSEARQYVSEKAGA